jgi:SEC-C motif domain protein
MEHCPCGSDLEFTACCAPLLSGESHAPTAEALMRSRYVAYVRHDMAYLRRTLDVSKRPGFDVKDVERWNKGVVWQGLRILSATAGGESDSAGEVEFTASFEQQGREYELHERSRFRRVEGRWFYVDGKADRSPRQGGAPVVRESPKVGRNAPCPCGSGRKFKKCCGA